MGFVTVAAEVATVVTAGVALWLLFQGHRDRRQLREELDRQNASQVTVSASSPWTPTGETSSRLTRSEVTVINESDRSVHLDQVTLVSPASWESYKARGHLRTTNPKLPQSLVRPGGEVPLELPSGWSPDGVDGSDFVIVEFRDVRGTRWERRSDTYELRPIAKRTNWAQRWFERLSPRWVHYLVVGIPMQWALRAARKNPDRMSLALRWCLAIEGEWKVGEQNSWFEPTGAPRLWRYDDLVPDKTLMAWSRDVPASRSLRRGSDDTPEEQ